jgi:hypothetical protein
MIQPEGFCSVEVKLLENGVIGNYNLSDPNFPIRRLFGQVDKFRLADHPGTGSVNVSQGRL